MSTAMLQDPPSSVPFGDPVTVDATGAESSLLLGLLDVIAYMEYEILVTNPPRPSRGKLWL